MRISTEIGWGNKPGGGRRVAINTLLAMARLRPSYEFLVYSNRTNPALDRPNIRQVALTPPKSVSQILWDQLLFPHWAVPRQLARDDHDVAHFTNNYVSAWGGQPAVVTIHDMTPFIIPETYGKAHGAYQRAYFRLAAHKAPQIVTVSEHSKEDICRILGIPDKRVTVVYPAANLKILDNPAVALPTDLAAEFAISRPYIFYVGAIHPRKNVDRLITAYAQLRRKHDIPHQLVVAGALRWMAEAILAASNNAGIADQDIIFTGLINDAQLVALYKQCTAFVYPSIYEGFGLPVLEAMSLGAPVVTSNTSSLPEAAGDAAVLVDPLDVASIVNGILKVLDSPSKAEEMREKGLKRAAQFSWELTGQRMLAVLEAVAGQPGAGTHTVPGN